jgi:hypothetical protein
MLAAELGDVVPAADVGVRDLARGPDLGQKRRAPHRILGQGAGQELERYGLADLQVVCAVDLTHPALAERGHDSITARDEGPGSETRGVGRDVRPLRGVIRGFRGRKQALVRSLGRRHPASRWKAGCRIAGIAATTPTQDANT